MDLRSSPEWQWFVRNLGSIVLVIAGFLMIVSAIWITPGGQPLAGVLVGFGSALTVIGASLPRVIEARFGPSGGSVKLREPGATAFSLELAEPGTPPPQAEDEDDLLGAARYFAAEQAIQALLTPPPAPAALSGCDLDLYTYDEAQEALVPIAGEQTLRRAWKAGQGAVGTAWAQGRFVFVSGAAVADGSYGLTVEQQERYRDFVAVAAIAVRNASAQTIGVLSAASGSEDNQLGTEEAREDLELLSLQAGRILVDLLRWFEDE